jgi:hypothetical protein
LAERLVPLPAVVVALAAAGCPIPPPPPVETTVAGVYTTRQPGEGGVRVVTLWLQNGGRASLETVVVGTGRLPVQEGTWSAAADVVTVRLGGAEPLVYTIFGDRLVPKQWDRAVYGESGLPLTRRAAYNRQTPGPFETQTPASGPR